jgi:RimJ/RimL family protein N-acetyltransferase
MFCNKDLQDIHEYYSNESCVKYTMGKALQVHESWRDMAIRTGHWLLHGYGPYALEEKIQHNVIGMVGLWNPPEWPEPEVTWHLTKKYQGRGYAKEAAQKVLEMATIYMPELSLISLIHPNNEPSLKLAEALGAQREKEILFRDDIWYIYRHKKLETKGG